MNKSTRSLTDPLDSRKAQKINKIINDAVRKTRNMCAIVECPSNGIEHFYCEKHLYKMLDAIKEEEENAKMKTKNEALDEAINAIAEVNTKWAFRYLDDKGFYLSTFNIVHNVFNEVEEVIEILKGLKDE